MSRSDPRAQAPPERDAELSALLDGELDATQAARLLEEIARSPALARRLEALRSVDGMLRGAAAPAPCPDLRARLRARIAADGHAPSRPGAPRRRAPRRIGPRQVAVGAAAAAALALLVLQPWSLREGTPELAEADPFFDDVLPEAALAVSQSALQPEDRPVVEVLDWLEVLEELEGNGQG